MSENMRETESSGADVESAIKAGLDKLGVKRSDVIIEVVDEGSKGLLGIGSRPAVVRMTSLVPAAGPARPAPVKPVTSSPKTPAAMPKEVIDQPDLEAESNTAVATVSELLNKMHVQANITTSMTEPDDVTGRRLPVVEIEGDDLGVLIGPRGETLNALQLVTRLMVGHRIRRRASFVIDVQGYRQRREQALARLAERTARKVSSRQRAVTLEPMPPHERRIIHITLRDSEDVFTQSVGEGKRRKVRIIPK